MILLQAQIYNCNNDYHINKIMKHQESPKHGRQRKLDSIIYDKGKKHFWNSRKRDYGLFESSQVYDWNYLDNNYSLQPERRRHSTVDTYQYQKKEEQPESRQNSAKKTYQKQKYLENKREKNLLHISNNIEVKLPAIKSSMIKQEPQNNMPTQQSNFQETPSKLKKQSVLTHNLTKRENIQRVKTETDANVYSERGRRVRFSPTYVCSFSNPMPTFKLYSSDSKKAIYSYGYGEQQA